MRTFALALFSLTTLFANAPIDVHNGAVLKHKFTCKDGSYAKYKENALFLFQKGEQCTALLGVPIDSNESEDSIEVFDGKKRSSIDFQISKKKYDAQYITLKTDKRVNLSNKNLDRYEKEKNEIKEILKNKNSILVKNLDFMLPVEGRLSSSYGLQRYYNNEPRSPHKGIDIAAKKGTIVKAMNSGRVIGVGDYFFNGKTVFLDHGGGLISMYCHLDKILVKVGDEVKKGAKIAKVGTTGRSTAPHLHLGVYLNDTWVDPRYFVRSKNW